MNKLGKKIREYYSFVRAKMSPLVRKSNVFCMSPWIQLHAQTDGKIAPCCMSSVSDGNELGNLRDNPKIEDAWNSDKMKELRLNMLKGKKSRICEYCYKYEEMGQASERQHYNKFFGKHFSRVLNTNKDGSIDEKDVLLIDMRFSNKCNYKCRICDSNYSSLWYQEEQKSGKKPLKGETIKQMLISEDQDTFWESFKNIIPRAERVHFAGGEPLIMEEHYRTLEYLISLKNTSLTLSYNTNLSVLGVSGHDVTALWNKFRDVEVWASLDDMGARGDYQRKGQRWSKIEQNIRTIQEKCTTVHFGVNVTVNILNILNIPVFLKHLIDNNYVKPDRINLYLLFDPDYYNITNLTSALKQEVMDSWQQFEKEYVDQLAQKKELKKKMWAILNYMNSKDSKLKKEFKQWINNIDKIRNENFLEVFPELEEMMHAEDEAAEVVDVAD